MSKLIAQFGDGITDNSGYFGANSSGTGTNAITNVETLISNMIGLLTVLGGIFFVFFFVLGAFSWITAGGDSSKIEKARNQMVQGVIGLIVMVAAYAIVGLIGTVVGLNLLNPGAELLKLKPDAANPTTGGATTTTFQDCIAQGNSFDVCDAL